MSRVLTTVAAVFFLGGLALVVGYLANQAVQWQRLGAINLEHAHYFYLGMAAASVGMITLALLEIRLAILIVAERQETSVSGESEARNSSSQPRAKHSWKKSAEVQRSFLDTRENP